MVKNLPAVQETQVCPWVGKIAKKGMAPTPVFLPGESHGQRSLGEYDTQSLKELDTTEET